jgi:ADP-ribose pyrophosphatase YjhB (NUDIX family)
MTGAQQFPKLGASACVWRDGHVLLVERAKPPLGLWSLPGGHVEAGETALDAARRELTEETGITATLTAFVGFYEVIRHDSSGTLAAHYAIACYTGLAEEGEAVAASDARALRWVLPGDIGRLPLAPNVKDAVLRAQSLLSL